MSIEEYNRNARALYYVDLRSYNARAQDQILSEVYITPWWKYPIKPILDAIKLVKIFKYHTKTELY